VRPSIFSYCCRRPLRRTPTRRTYLVEKRRENEEAENLALELDSSRLMPNVLSLV
jgi:hypothetical protein